MRPTDRIEHEGVKVRHLGGHGAYIYRMGRMALDGGGSPAHATRAAWGSHASCG